MTGPLSQGSRRSLALADGSRWVIAAGDEESVHIVSRLANVMQLRETGTTAQLPPDRFKVIGAGAGEPRAAEGVARCLLVRVGAHTSPASPATSPPPLHREDDGSVVCVLRPIRHSTGLFTQFVELSLIIAHDAQTRGGVLLHGALAEKDGGGVILAAPGGTGKTTASNRLPAPWRSRCDDTTLVVRDAHGSYWAHPWPTWSSLLRKEPEGTWDVQSAVPLKGVFFLSRAVEDRVEAVGPGRALSLLVESAGQAAPLRARGRCKEETRARHLERFDNLCALVRVIPAHVLHISLTGAFWQELGG